MPDYNNRYQNINNPPALYRDSRELEARRRQRAAKRLKKQKRSLYLLFGIVALLFVLALIIGAAWMRWIFAFFAVVLAILGCIIPIPGMTRGVYFVGCLLLIGIALLPVLKKDEQGNRQEVESILAPSPTPAPTVDVSAGFHHGIANNLVLYFHESGSSYYHTDMNCDAVVSAYLPLKNQLFYKELVDSKFSGMMPCATCDSPARPHSH